MWSLQKCGLFFIARHCSKGHFQKTLNDYVGVVGAFGDNPNVFLHTPKHRSGKRKNLDLSALK